MVGFLEIRDIQETITDPCNERNTDDTEKAPSNFIGTHGLDLPSVSYPYLRIVQRIPSHNGWAPKTLVVMAMMDTPRSARKLRNGTRNWNIRLVPRFISDTSQ